MSRKFSSDNVVVTSGVNNWIQEDPAAEKFVDDALMAHFAGQWGEICEDDKLENEAALTEGGRLMSVFIDNKKIWIITEHDRSVTTVLFPDEY